MDDPQREHIHDDLKGVFQGKLLFDDLSRALYSTDASLFQVRPLGVAVPRDEADVQTLVRYAAEHRVPLIARGAGSGVAGESLGSGIIVDLSQHFRGIIDVGSDTVRVQPGVVLQQLNARLARDGRYFAPDPASALQCTIGGMLANNASGARSMKHGYTRDHVTALRAVLDNGEIADVAPFDFRQAMSNGTSRRLQDIAVAVTGLLERNHDLIQRTPRRTRFDRCGYKLDGVLAPPFLDLTRVLVGSEGTLAIFTEATLRTLPLPEGRAVVLLGFDTLDRALKASQKLMPSAPAACELIDRRLLTLARGGDGIDLIPPQVETILLIEYESDEPDEALARARQAMDDLERGEPLACHKALATSSDEIDRLWRLRESALPNLYGLKGGPLPVPFIEDVGVPVEQLPQYLRSVQDILQQHETTASYLVHAGSGQVHTRPFLDLRNPADRDKLWAIAEKVHGLALDLGGTISTQHGTGLSRTPWVARQYGALYPVLRDIKNIFDPQQIFNPGKIIAPFADAADWPLKKPIASMVAPLANGEALDTVELPPEHTVGDAAAPAPHLLLWTKDDPREEVARCNGCGTCRSQSPAQRMCPIFRANPIEAATPRAKANLLRSLFQEGGDPRQLGSDDVRSVADLCVNCKMCAVECPARVNIPKLMLEAKAANVAAHGLSRSNAALARTEDFAALGSAFALLTNAFLGSPAARWLLEKLLGISRRRKLPAFAARSFLQRAVRQGWTRRSRRASRPTLVYFVDVFANYNDPTIAEAVVAVLRHNGFDVFIPPGQVGCGMAPLAQGDVEAAREAAQRNLRVLADLAREGHLILCSEPTAALMLQSDYLDLIDDPDARLVAGNVVELTAFLGDLHRQGRLRTDFQHLDLTLGHHVPCHLKALGAAPAAPGLLSLIPGVRVRTIDVSCSGMAGTFGLKAENYDVSRAAGRPMLEELSRPSVLFGSTECSTCRLQMEDGSNKRTLHPVQYLALAYGLMPELGKRLRQPIRGLVLR